jgi:L-serine dehydratase
MNPLRADQIGPLDMFKIGIGPSSSHTVGPMIAALEFRNSIISEKLPFAIVDPHIQVELYGSLSATGRGHSTDGAICAGIAGKHPRISAPEEIWSAMPELRRNPQVSIDDAVCRFQPDEDIKWEGWLIDGRGLPHPNTIRFRVLSGDKIVKEQIILSVGGGFVEPIDSATGQQSGPTERIYQRPLPYPYNSAAEFVQQCVASGKPAWQVVIANEEAKGLSEVKLRGRLSEILRTFDACIDRGLNAEGILPGGLNLRRRAKALWTQLKEGKSPGWAGNDLRPSIYAIAVNEENAAGGRVVTARPTALPA